MDLVEAFVSMIVTMYVRKRSDRMAGEMGMGMAVVVVMGMAVADGDGIGDGRA